MFPSKFEGESSMTDHTCEAKDFQATHRSDLSKKLYSPVLDRRTHSFARKQKISFWKYTFGTVGGQKGVYVCWESGKFLRCFHMKWCHSFWHIGLACLLPDHDGISLNGRPVFPPCGWQRRTMYILVASVLFDFSFQLGAKQFIRATISNYF